MTELCNAVIAPYTSMRVGGTVKRICFPQNIAELKNLICNFRDLGEEYIIAGNASNVIFSDMGYDGTVIFTKNCTALTHDGDVVTAECGASVNSLSQYANSLSLTGLEFIFGVPGTVGGAVYMNAGCYGGEIADCFLKCEVMDEKGDMLTLFKDDMHFSYRHSVLSEKKYILLSASFLLEKGDSSLSMSIIKENMAKRKAKQPLEYPSCGSFFKRPEGNYAGALIEQCGLKGCSVGGAQVSEKHAGFIINKGGATADDIYRLSKLVSDTVKEKTGYILEPEVIFLS